MGGEELELELELERKRCTSKLGTFSQDLVSAESTTDPAHRTDLYLASL